MALSDKPNWYDLTPEERRQWDDYEEVGAKLGRAIGDFFYDCHLRAKYFADTGDDMLSMYMDCDECRICDVEKHAILQGFNAALEEVAKRAERQPLAKQVVAKAMDDGQKAIDAIWQIPVNDVRKWELIWAAVDRLEQGYKGIHAEAYYSELTNKVRAEHRIWEARQQGRAA